MPATTQPRRTPSAVGLAKLSEKLRALKKRLVQPVPDDLAVCEFECRCEHCDKQQWQDCNLRHRPQK